MRLSPLGLSAPDAPNDGRLRLAVDLCCAPSAAAPVVPPRRRARLGDLDMHLHCSIIGTCLGTAELRRLVPRHAGLDRERATDLEIHHAAVQLAVEGGPGRKALQKALDDRYAGVLRRFDKARGEDAVRTLWREALKAGDVPPAYWAVMTHPDATFALRQEAFGEVHMLSHLVGAANRADIRRLVALEAENAELKHKVERQQRRLQEFSLQRDAAQAALQAEAARAAAREAADAAPPAEPQALRDALARSQQEVALHVTRRQAVEAQLAQAREQAGHLQADVARSADTIRALGAELAAAESALRQAAAAEGQGADAPAAALAGLRVAYVGGRPGATAALRRLVESAGGELMLHDGGLEARKGLLGGLLQGADMVVFPVDCIDHDSMHTIKRLCERARIPYHPLRTASVACFLELAGRLAVQAARQAEPAPRFCLRHG